MTEIAGLSHGQNNQLPILIERIEQGIAERDQANSDIREVYVEAKLLGYDVTVLRQVVKERAMSATDREKREEREALLEVYMDALVDFTTGA